MPPIALQRRKMRLNPYFRIILKGLEYTLNHIQLKYNLYPSTR